MSDDSRTTTKKPPRRRPRKKKASASKKKTASKKASTKKAVTKKTSAKAATKNTPKAAVTETTRRKRVLPEIDKESSNKIQRVLVANRGEIAIRVIRACRELGLEVVAVASEADRFALHAQLADAVVELGPAPASESYLKGNRVVRAALETGCDALHPGYGFLAENASFADEVISAGLVFIGPTPEVIQEMGLKTRARARMVTAGVPVVPGALLDDDASELDIKKSGTAVGFPLLVKASAGGGGKGMRRVDSPEELPAAVAAARREAGAAFADSEVYLEKLLHRPRHIEVQVLGDRLGHVVHLGERECSIQRRHQKIIEESPAPNLSPELRDAMRRTAVQAATAVGYQGAGTVEMLLDEDGAYYFLEMNTRLQVEHPVTEWVTGVDIVAEQIRLAQGEAIRFEQSELELRGHSIEARLYAEDPANNFLPQTGEVMLFEPPGGPGVRVDTGIANGTEVSLHYDPMIAKISTWGEDRDFARRRLVEALRETVLVGLTTNQGYLLDVLGHYAYARGETHTGFIEEFLSDWGSISIPPQDEDAFLAAAAALFSSQTTTAREDNSSSGPAQIAGPWSTLGPRRFGGAK